MKVGGNKKNVASRIDGLEIMLNINVLLSDDMKMFRTTHVTEEALLVIQSDPTVKVEKASRGVEPKVNHDLFVGMITVERETVEENKTRDTDDVGPINTDVVQDSMDMPTASATEMVVAQSRITEI